MKGEEKTAKEDQMVASIIAWKNIGKKILVVREMTKKRKSDEKTRKKERNYCENKMIKKGSKTMRWMLNVTIIDHNLK